MSKPTDLVQSTLDLLILKTRCPGRSLDRNIRPPACLCVRPRRRGPRGPSNGNRLRSRV